MMRKCAGAFAALCSLTLAFHAPVMAFAAQTGIDPTVPTRSSIPKERAQLLAKKKYKLSKTIYKKIGGWWTDASSGGYDRKITRSKFKIYSRATGKSVGTMKICGSKTVKGGYLIRLKNSNGAKLCYRYNKKADVMENFYNGWKADPNYYSGSSSMFRGKWK